MNRSKSIQGHTQCLSYLGSISNMHGKILFIKFNNIFYLISLFI
jgi:hypothetical protein